MKVNGLTMVAAIMAIGFAGSQYSQTTGALSGQAAGGDSAGCGGDTYYDEDLQALVGSEAGAMEGASSLRDAGVQDASVELQRGIVGQAFGQAMEGQPLLRLLEPSPAALARLVELGGEKAQFQASVDIANDGSFAVVAFASEGYPQVTEVSILENIGSKWLAYPVVASDDGRPFKFRSVELIDVVSGELGSEVVVLLNGQDYLRLAPASGSLFLETQAVANDLVHDNARAAGSIELYTAQLRSMEDARDVVIRRVDHPWMRTLVDKFFEGARYEFDTSVTNEVLITLEGGTVISVAGCQFGAEPSFDGPELVCDACPSGDVCSNPFNRRNLYDVSIAERDVTIGGVAF